MPTATTATRPSLTPLSAYPLHLPVFEGPLDLLLYLIRKQELDITDIPIARITEQYTAYLAAMEEMNLDVASEYVLMVATLIHIKTKMLLPRLPLDEEIDPEDPRQELVERLLEYERFKGVSDEMRRLEEARMAVHVRADSVLERFGAVEGIEADAFDLARAFEEVIARHTRGETVLEAEEYSIEEKCAAILMRLDERGGMMNFKEVFEHARSLLEAISIFVALLELLRRRKARAHQGCAFGEILIYSREEDAPEIETEKTELMQ